MIDKETFIKDKGWYTYYNPKYWVHRQFESPSRDHTNHGFSLDDAYQFETDEEFKDKCLKAIQMRSAILSYLSDKGCK